MLHYLKVREIIQCGECGIEGAVYSMYEHGGKIKEGLPTLDDYNRLQCRLESGYICGEALDIQFYHTKEEHCCNGTIEPH